MTHPKYYPTSEASVDILKFQWVLQMVSFIGFLLFQTLNWSGLHATSPSRCKGVIAYTGLVTILFIVPIISIVHWSINYEAAFNDPSNNIKEWLLVYPLMGVLDLYFFYMIQESL